MIEKVSEYIVSDILFKNETISEEKREIMTFGVRRIVEDTPKYLAIVAICTYLNALIQLLIVLLVTFTYKTYVGGAHARTNIGCFISTLILFLTPILLPKYIIFSNIAKFVLYGLVLLSSAYIIIKIAPGDTEEIPVLKKDKRKVMKIKATISLMMWIILTWFVIKNEYYSQIILLTILLINLVATNTSYKIFRCKHSYESEEFANYFNQ